MKEIFTNIIEYSYREYIDNIITHFHISTRNLCAEILEQTYQNREKYPHIIELSILEKNMQDFSKAMNEHLKKEEEILFPLIIELDTTTDLTFRNILLRPIAKIEEEHKEHGEKIIPITNIIEFLKNESELEIEGMLGLIDELISLTMEHIYVEDELLFNHIQRKMK